MIAVKDPVYGFWTLYDKKSGNRFVVTFSKDTNANRSSIPMLVDMKITDYCPYGCSYCYMASTTRGKHASYEDVCGYLDTMAQNQVLEVALGGGEPTLHPHFFDILNYGEALGITMNFTTKNPRVIRDMGLYLSHGGTFAFSVSTPKQFEDMLVAYQAHTDKPKVNAHLVMGTISEQEYCDYLALANKYGGRLTLLGYKTSGFGQAYAGNMVSYDWWIHHLENYPNAYISVDTSMVKQYKSAIEMAGIPDFLYHEEDGLHSAYIDAVNHYFAPASYVELHDKWKATPVQFASEFAQRFSEFEAV